MLWTQAAYLPGAPAGGAPELAKPRQALATTGKMRAPRVCAIVGYRMWSSGAERWPSNGMSVGLTVLGVEGSK